MCLCLFFRKFPVACSHQCSSDKLPLHPAEVILLFFSCYVWPLFAISWSIARQAPLSMDFPRQECWSRWPSPSARDLPNLGIKLVSPASAVGFCTNEYVAMRSTNIPDRFYGIHLCTIDPGWIDWGAEQANPNA